MRVRMKASSEFRKCTKIALIGLAVPGGVQLNCSAVIPFMDSSVWRRTAATNCWINSMVSINYSLGFVGLIYFTLISKRKLIQGLKLLLVATIHFTGVRITTGMTRTVLRWYSAKPGIISTMWLYKRVRSGSTAMDARAWNCSVPVSTLTSGLARML